MRQLTSLLNSFIFLCVVCVCDQALAAETIAEKVKPVTIVKSHAIALRGTPKYAADFKHWDYVNPNAPQGGEIKYAIQGNFDGFNPFASRGTSASDISYMFDSLMKSNFDEISVYYGLIAEYIEYPSDYSWVKFYINKNAKFQDGRSITAEDVVFSFNKFMLQATPGFKTYFKGVIVSKENDLLVKFSLPEPSKSLLLGIASLDILPKHIYADIDISNPVTQPLVGSGALRVSDYKMGKYVVLEQLPNYWAKAHPTNVGLLNFKNYRYDYYLDESILIEAFKKGEYDYRVENVSKNWESQYVGEMFDKGYVVKELIPHEIPTANQSFVFNIQRDKFKSQMVRKAIGLLFDFEWTNKNLFYNAYERNKSYFINTQYSAAKGLPLARESEILKSLKIDLPDEMFTQIYEPHKTDGSGNIRKEIRQALSLFKEAGYGVKDKVLVDANGKPFEFELLIYTPSMERVVIPFKEKLERIGVTMNVRLVSDTTQYVNRLRNRDYDMVIRHLGGFPTAGLKAEWHSGYLDAQTSAVGTQDPALDYLLEQIEKNQENEEELIAYARAFDRLLLWREYVIPQWHFSKHRVAYWNKFSRPAVVPKYDLGEITWWFDKTKAEKLPAKNQN